MIHLFQPGSKIPTALGHIVQQTVIYIYIPHGLTLFQIRICQIFPWQKGPNLTFAYF